MKNKLTVLLLILTIGCFNSTTMATSSIRPINSHEKLARDIQAYVYMQNEWIQGSVTYSESQGLITGVQFPRTDNGTAYLSGPVRPTPLNPNNALAVKYNFTHYVDMAAYGRAYFILN
jgi:hypothetical protein